MLESTVAIYDGIKKGHRICDTLYGERIVHRLEKPIEEARDFLPKMAESTGGFNYHHLLRW